MTVRLKNTTTDRTKAHLHRTAPRLEMEPSFGGTRIRMGGHLDITNEQYAQNKITIDDWVSKGMVEVSGVAPAEKKVQYDATGMRLDGPTLEEWVKAGYHAEYYPPRDYAEKPSKGLTEFRARQEADAVEAKKSLEEAERRQAAEIAAEVDRKIGEEMDAEVARVATTVATEVAVEVKESILVPVVEKVVEKPMPAAPAFLEIERAVVENKADTTPTSEPKKKSKKLF